MTTIPLMPATNTSVTPAPVTTTLDTLQDSDRIEDVPHIASNTTGLPTPSSLGFELLATENSPGPAIANITSGQNVVQTMPSIVQVESTNILETGENSTKHNKVWR